MFQTDQQGLIVRQKSPLNLEFQFSSLSNWIVPTDQFFVRSHFAFPDIPESAYQLSVDGSVDNTMTFSLADLKAMPTTTIIAVTECAGNSRVYYVPAKEGLQWQNGAVGNASWTGVLLKDVLAAAGVKPEALEIILVGADRGNVDDGKKTASPGPIHYARSMPLAKAMSEDVLLAWEMNGEPLTTEHGQPIRAVVGGWLGMAWVKWVTHVRVVDRPFNGYWQARDYFRWERVFGEPTLIPITELEVKAQIARPVNGATIRVGEPYRIYGAAWTGEASVTSVQISTDGGSSWNEASLTGSETKHSWRLWEFYWTPMETGRYSVLCKAVDSKGNIQPDTPQPDRESYLANWQVPVEVRVVDSKAAFEDEFSI